jgi:hypothetical protein
LQNADCRFAIGTQSQIADHRSQIANQMTDLERLTAALTDRYAIQEELGAGGMATVYRGPGPPRARKTILSRHP